MLIRKHIFFSIIFLFIFIFCKPIVEAGPSDAQAEAQTFADTQKVGDKEGYQAQIQSSITGVPNYSDAEVDNYKTKGGDWQGDPASFIEDTQAEAVTNEQNQFMQNSFLYRPKVDPCRDVGPAGVFTCNQSLSVSVEFLDQTCSIYDNTVFVGEITCNIQTSVAVSYEERTAQTSCTVGGGPCGRNCSEVSVIWCAPSLQDCGTGNNIYTMCFYNYTYTVAVENETITDGCSTYASDSNYVLLSSTCLDSGTKNINGTDVYRACWDTQNAYSSREDSSDNQCSDYENNPDYTLKTSQCVDTGCKTISNQNICKDCWVTEKVFEYANAVDNWDNSSCASYAAYE